MPDTIKKYNPNPLSPYQSPKWPDSDSSFINILNICVWDAMSTKTVVNTVRF